MKELTYLVKDIKDKNDLFWFKFLEDINRNKFVLEEMLSKIFVFFKFNCNVCVVESTIEFEHFKCIYKNNDTIDERVWCLLKTNVLKEVAIKNQLQNATVNKKIVGTDEIISESYYVHPIITKNNIFYIIFDYLDTKCKPRYALAFESLFCLFQTCERNDLLSKYTMIDSVTGCYNFNQFQRALGAEIAKIDRADDDIVFSVMIFDIQGLDKINEKYGYTFGDSILKKVSKGLKEKIRNTDDAYRVGGDEFYIINTRASKEVCRDFILPRIQKEISQKIHIKDGIYYYPQVDVAIVQYRRGLTRTNFERLMEESLMEAKNTHEIVIV